MATSLVSYGADAAVLSPLGEAPAVALSELVSLDLLRDAGLAVVEAIAVPDAAAANRAAERIGGDVALKLDVAGLSHKSDIGGVALGLRGEAAVGAAATRLLDIDARDGRTVRGLLVTPMIPGVELIVGLRRDPQFGPVVLVGLGGTLAEVLDDVAIRLAPLGRADADAMLDDLRGAAVLRGTRGRPPIDRGAVASMLVALATLGVERPDILEVDLNPVMASETGAIAVDALVVVSERVDV